MSRAQRLTFLGIAAVIAVVAVVLITRGDATTDTASTPTATPTASQQEASPGDATPTATATPTAAPVKTLKGPKVTKLKVTQGDTVRFKATADQPDEIHVHGYDLMKDITKPGGTVSFAFKATITGVFEIEYEDAGEQIGQLTVEPK